MRITQYLSSKLKNFSNLPKEYIERSKKQASNWFPLINEFSCKLT